MKKAEKDTGHSFEDYFKRALNPLIILSILQERPKYAYEMTQELRQRSRDVYNMPLLYPVLYRLESNGYVEISETVISDKNRVRNYYRITDAGRAYLEVCKAQYQQLTKIANSFLNLSNGGSE
jgi:PadR family transcriptional regulator, regulatory protein PadR